MRLFFCLLYNAGGAFFLFAAPDYIPFIHYNGATAQLAEDLNPESRTAKFHLTQISSGKSLTAGVSLDCELRIPSPDRNHYRGEIVRIDFRNNRHGPVGIGYAGRFKSRRTALRGRILVIIGNVFTLLDEPGYFLEALILGKTDRIKDIKEIFRKAGLSHLLALSGLHIGIVCALFYLVFRPLLPHSLTGPIIILLLCFYAWLIGTRHSFLRALIMVSLANICHVFNIKPVLGKILALSALMQICLWPGCYSSWSFILSYGAMGGILFLSPWTTLMLKKVLPDFLAVPLGVSLSAQFIVIPLILPSFGSFQPVGLISGILMTPLIALFLWTGIGTLIILLSIPSALPLIKPVLSHYYYFMKGMALFFSRFPLCEWDSWPGKLLFFLLLSGIMGLIFFCITKEGHIVGKSTQAKL